MTSNAKPARGPVGGGRTALRMPTKALSVPEAIAEAEGNEHAATDRIVAVTVLIAIAWIAFLAWLIART